jgi:TolB protein
MNLKQANTASKQRIKANGMKEMASQRRKLKSFSDISLCPSFFLYLLGICLILINTVQSSTILAKNEKMDGLPVAGTPPGKIVFSALKDGNWDLWIMDSDGSNPVQLTRTPIDERSPCVSNDGERILYGTSEGCLRLMDVNGHTDEKILLPDGYYNNPVWLNDMEILFVTYIFKADKYEVKDDSSLMIFDLDREVSKSNPFVLIEQTGMQDWPSISPQGGLIYISSVQGPNQKITQEIWKYDLIAQDGSQITLMNANSIHPRWSPDGKEIVFASNKTGNFEIWKLNITTGNTIRLTNADCTNKEPCWSPDGKDIIFVSDRRGHNEIWKMSSAGEVRGVILPFKEKIECQYPFWFGDYTSKGQ